MVELQIVVLAVAGSSPVGHPICVFSWIAGAATESMSFPPRKPHAYQLVRKTYACQPLQLSMAIFVHFARF